jgi:hypothetical protein
MLSQNLCAQVLVEWSAWLNRVASVAELIRWSGSIQVIGSTHSVWDRISECGLKKSPRQYHAKA